MEFEALRVGIAVLGCIIATYYDLFNNRNVPNVLTYSMVGAGVLFSVLSFDFGSLLGGDFTQSLITFGPALVFLIFGYYLYINGQMGGADVLIFLAIALLLPEQPASLVGRQTAPFLKIPYIISIFIISGVLFSFYMLIRMVPRIILAVLKKEVTLELPKLLMAIFFVVMYEIFLVNMSGLVPKAYLAITAVVGVSAMFIYIFKDFILERYIIEYVPLGKIDEEDVLAVDRLDPEAVKKYQLKKLLTAKELERLKKVPIREYPIYKNMPCFMPYILAAVLLTLFTGDIFVFLMKFG